MLLPTPFLLLLATAASVQVQAAPDSLSAITDALGEPVRLRMPRTVLKESNRAVAFMERAWGLWGGKIQSGAKYFSFAQPDWLDTDSPVLQIWYPQGSFGADGGGGAHFYSTALRDGRGDGKELSTMLVSYEVAFEPGFEFHLGGKLPGLRGGNPNGCGGGLSADGLHCESTRLMFREWGAGEVYAYIPTTPALCGEGIPRVECNDAYGTSLSRGSFNFPSDGSWTKISLFVVLNSPASASNGIIQIYADGELAMSHENLQIRANDTIFEGGLWFSSFFGGGNETWASPRDQHSYFRGFEQSGSTALPEDWPTPEYEEDPAEEETDPAGEQDEEETTSSSTPSATGTATRVGASTTVSPLHAAVGSVSASAVPASTQLSGAGLRVLMSKGAVWVGVMGALLIV